MHPVVFFIENNGYQIVDHVRICDGVPLVVWLNSLVVERWTCD